MKDIDVNRALLTKRNRLGFGDLLSFLAPVIFFYSLLIIDIYKLIKAQLIGIEVSSSIFNKEFDILHVFIIIGTLILITKILSLRYKVIDVTVTNNRFKAILDILIEKFKWNTVQKGENFVVVETEPNFYSQNERVTIVYNDNYIMANSICNPDNSRQLFSYGRNQSNLKNIQNEFFKENFRTKEMPAYNKP